MLSRISPKNNVKVFSLQKIYKDERKILVKGAKSSFSLITIKYRGVNGKLSDSLKI
jgi:hypothetical protein